MSLAEYLKTDLRQNSGYWFDFKNLDSADALPACRIMNSIVSDLGIHKNNIVVESSEYSLLQLFAEKGFNISYYIPDLRKLPADSLHNAISEINVALHAYPKLGISSEYKNYPIMKQYFPSTIKRLWYNGPVRSFWNWRNKVNLYRMMIDPSVRVLLIPYTPKFGKDKRYNI